MLPLLFSHHAEAAEPQDLYTEPMTVKLVPSAKPSVTITGSYELIDLDTGDTIDIDNDIIFEHNSNEVTAVVSGSKKYTSDEGYSLQENGPFANNFLTISKVFPAGASTSSNNQYRGSLIIEPAGGSAPEIYNVLNMEDYLKGVVPREISAGWPVESLKAQAVAARNYAKVNMSNNNFLYDTVQSQVYAGRTGEHTRSNQAVDETKGKVATHNGSLITAYYHASSGGYTENSENVWSTALPYTRAVEDPFDNHSANPNTSWSENITKEQLGQAVFKSSWIVVDVKVVERSDAGRVQKLEVSAVNKSSGARETRIVPNGTSPDSIRNNVGKTLKSTMFDVKKEGGSVKVKTAGGAEETHDQALGMKLKQPDGSESTINYENLAVRQAGGSTDYISTAASSFIFTGKGWGHGLGMSQWGAYNMANQGKSYEEILKHYYTGIQIVQQ
ncbi:SpoIID/LytB domain-containing protein [Alteribacillus sp. HJP-4]